MDEIGAINDYVQDASGNTADLIWGNTTNEDLENRISVTVVATGFDTDVIHDLYSKKQKVKTIHNLDNDKIKVEKIRDEKEDKQKIEEEKINKQKQKEEQDKEKKYKEEQEKKLEIKKQEERKEQEKKDKAEELEKQDKNEFFVIDIDQDSTSDKDKNNGKVLFEDDGEVDFIEVEKLNESRKRIAMEYNDSKKLESLENVPAYKRKKMKLDLENTEKNNVSKYKLEE